MVNAVLISSDSRMSLQVKDWFRELVHDVRLETFAGLSEFAKAYTDDSDAEILAKKQTQSSDVNVNADATLAAVSEIKNRPRVRLLIVDADVLEQKATAWTTEIRKVLAHKGFEDPEQPIRILLLAFEDPKVSVTEFRHSSVNDLVLKPLERSLFLQKIEFLIADTPDVKPSFLFRQPVQAAIEMGKDTWLEEISEFVISIANPSPLKGGMFISVHSEIFGEGAASQIYARVLGNLKHPIRKDAFLVRMTYFGITAAQLTRVRHYIRDHFPESKPKITDIERAKRLLTAQESDRDGAIEKRVAIIEMNREIASTMESALRAHFSGLDVRSFSSYARFMGELIKNSGVGVGGGFGGSGQSAPVHSVSIASMIPASEEEADLLSIAAEAGISSVLMSEDTHQTAASRAESQAGTAVAASPASPQKPAFPQGKSLSVILDAITHQLIRFDAPLAPSALVLARRVMEWNVQPALWSESIFPEDHEEYLEFLNYISHGAQGNTLLRMIDANGETVYVDIKGTLEKTGKSEDETSGEQELSAHLRVDFREIEASKWHAESEKHHREADHLAYQFDLIFIDGAFIRGDVPNWIAGLKNIFSKAGVTLDSTGANGGLPPIVILGEERSSLTPQNFRHSEIFGFLAKPLDRRIVSEMAAQFVPEISFRGDSEALIPHPCKIEICTATDAQMNGISEFGLSIVQNTPASSLRPNTYMRFFSPIFGSSVKGVLGRCAYSQAVTENEKTVSESQFHFFGVNDELFRRIRTWIVENYVNSKQGS